jgi:hypothetical protein
MKKISEIYQEKAGQRSLPTFHKFWTDKDDLGYLANIYDSLLNRRDYENILEIGVEGGGSIALWEACFPESNIFGADIRDFPQPDRAAKLIGNAYCDEFISQFDDDFFDVIIDDGPHTYASFIALVNKYYVKLKKGGLLVIEDVIRPRRRMGVTEEQQLDLMSLIESIGYKNVKTWDMTGKHKLEKLRNKWSKGIFVITMER